MANSPFFRPSVKTKATVDFNVYASEVGKNGERYLTEADLMQARRIRMHATDWELHHFPQCFGVRLGRSIFQEELSKEQQRRRQERGDSAHASANPSQPPLLARQRSLPAGISQDSFLLMAGVASAPRSSLREAFELFDANGDGFVSLEVGRTNVFHGAAAHMPHRALVIPLPLFYG